MKLYTIKPLEWLEDNGWHYSRNGWIISRAVIGGNYTYALTVDNACVYSDIETVEKAKELAETLHAADVESLLEEWEEDCDRLDADEN